MKKVGEFSRIFKIFIWGVGRVGDRCWVNYWNGVDLERNWVGGKIKRWSKEVYWVVRREGWLDFRFVVNGVWSYGLSEFIWVGGVDREEERV